MNRWVTVIAICAAAVLLGADAGFNLEALAQTTRPPP